MARPSSRPSGRRARTRPSVAWRLPRGARTSSPIARPRPLRSVSSGSGGPRREPLGDRPRPRRRRRTSRGLCTRRSPTAAGCRRAAPLASLRRDADLGTSSIVSHTPRLLGDGVSGVADGAGGAARRHPRHGDARWCSAFRVMIWRGRTPRLRSSGGVHHQPAGLEAGDLSSLRWIDSRSTPLNSMGGHAEHLERESTAGALAR